MSHPPYPPSPSPWYPPAAPTNGKAQAALWIGVGLLVTSCCGVGVFGVVPVILGVQARREIAESAGHQRGDEMALAGIVTGAIAIAVSILVLTALVVAVTLWGGGSTGYGGNGV
jgi:Domain of unknown function (DUF4190)